MQRDNPYEAPVSKGNHACDCGRVTFVDGAILFFTFISGLGVGALIAAWQITVNL